MQHHTPQAVTCTAAAQQKPKDQHNTHSHTCPLFFLYTASHPTSSDHYTAEVSEGSMQEGLASVAQMARRVMDAGNEASGRTEVGGCLFEYKI